MRWTGLGYGTLLAISVLTWGCKPTVTDKSTSDSCKSCHQPDGKPGLETIHLNYALSCVDCHGGDATKPNKAEAHVSPNGSPKNLRDLPPTALDDVDPDYMRFVNPSDYRVVNQSCGSTSPQGAATGCHQGIIDKSKRSIHATLAGIITVPRYNAGIQATKNAIKAATTIDHPEHDPATAPAFTVASVEQLEIVDLTGKGKNDMEDFHAHTMAKRCTKCHLGKFGGGTSPKNFGNFRSSGCAGCHMVYENDGLSQSGDPMMDKEFPSHPAKHELTSAIPDYQCEHCHWRGNRAGTAYRGWRERPTGSLDVKENTLRNSEPLHTRGKDFFIIDEDTRNDVDETPPDIHYTLGVACIDCHIQRDVHGDGYIHSTMDLEMGMECVDCHGGYDAPANEDDQGRFMTTGGDHLKHVSRKSGGNIVMTGLVSKKEHNLTQIVDLPANDTLASAHSTANHGELECYACHTAWSQNCYGCHTVIDMRFASTFPISGVSSPGKTAGNREVVTLENLHLGINSDGKIGTLMVQTLFQTVIVPCDPETTTSSCTIDVDGLIPGRKLIDSQIRKSHDGRIGLSWGPAMAHTTADKTTVQTCDRCHMKRDGSNREKVRLTYGFGNGQYTFTDGESGIEYDLTQAISSTTGEALVSFGHPGAGPVPFDRIQKAMAVEVD